jgi:quercetin dioxygenase-like cupin family protein
VRPGNYSGFNAIFFISGVRRWAFSRGLGGFFLSLVTGGWSLSSMSFLDLDQLPFVGMSYDFIGENHGAPFSAYIVNAKPGQGPPLHTHPYVEVAFTLEGRATITVGDETREVKAGGIVVIPANTPHRFVNSGDTLLRQIDVHASPTFIQTNL